MPRLCDVLGLTLENDDVVIAAEIDGNGWVGVQIPHPARLWGTTEAESAVDPNAVHWTHVRTAGWRYRGNPVVWGGAQALLD
jgi:hypothetical protein